MTLAPRRMGTSDSLNPAKHSSVTDPPPASASARCCSSKQAAQLRLFAAIITQNGLRFFAPCSGSRNEPAVRRTSGKPVAVWNACW